MAKTYSELREEYIGALDAWAQGLSRKFEQYKDDLKLAIDEVGKEGFPKSKAMCSKIYNTVEKNIPKLKSAIESGEIALFVSLYKETDNAFDDLKKYTAKIKSTPAHEYIEQVNSLLFNIEIYIFLEMGRVIGKIDNNNEADLVERVKKEFKFDELKRRA